MITNYHDDYRAVEKLLVAPWLPSLFNIYYRKNEHHSSVHSSLHAPYDIWRTATRLAAASTAASGRGPPYLPSELPVASLGDVRCNG